MTEEEAKRCAENMTYRSNGTNYGTDESVELKAEDEGQRMKTYEDGLNEAWEAARRLQNEFTLFGYWSPYEVVNALTPQEVIERLKKHDAENRIVHVGDEIYSELTNCKAVVQRIDSWNRYQCFNDGGSQFVIGTETFNDYWVKTGKNYPQIAEVLKQMQEGSK